MGKPRTRSTNINKESSTKKTMLTKSKQVVKTYTSLKTKKKLVQDAKDNVFSLPTSRKVKIVIKDECTPQPSSEPIKSVYKACSKHVGAHVSIAGGLHNAVTNAVAIGAKSFALFLKSQRQWNCKPLEDVAAKKFRDACIEYGYPSHLIVPHGSYLLNCGSPDPETLAKSRVALTDELQRCDRLGLALFNFHPGSTCGKISRVKSISLIAESINIALGKTKSVTAVIENMSRQGNTLGGDFQELADIIALVNDKSRVGVCLETCHAFAAGYNLASESGYDQMMNEFESVVGLKYLKAVHVNDSMGKVGCHLDRHQNIGKGEIGLKAFKRMMNDPRFDNIPLVLETPAENDDVYAKEIKLLYSLCQPEKK